MIPTAPELALLRTRPHATKLWLSIYQPTIVLACRLNNASAAKGDRTIIYDGVTSGSYLNIWSGMTMYVGRSPNSADKGRIRVKSATSSTIVVSENDHIDWEDDDYLTVVRYFEPWSIYPRIIQDPSDEENVIFYKDYDVVYSNQNSVLGSFINMGCHYAGFKTPGGNAQVYFSASGTSNLKGDSLTYAWFFEGGTPTGSTSNTPGYITYSTPGHYIARLTVTGGGSSDISYRHVSIYDRPENGTVVPILAWELEGLTGSRDQGGYAGRIKIHQNIPEETIREGALIVIFADDYYGSTQQSIGGSSINRQSIVFVGYIMNGSIEYDYQQNFIEFDVISITDVMKELPGFVIDVESKTSPSTWFELLNMDCRRAMYHYLKWHSTVLLCADFQFIGDDKNIQFYNSERASVYDAVNEFMKSTLVGEVVADRQGKIFAEVGVRATNNATGTFSVGMQLSDQDWIGDVNIDEIQSEPLSYLEMGGIAYDGPASGTFSALIACAPGDAPAYRGGLEQAQGLALTSQSQLNTLVGNVLAYRNSKYPAVSVDLSGNYRNLDIAPQEIVALNVDLTDTYRNIVWQNKHFHITDMSWSYIPDKESFLPSMTLHEITQGFSGDTIIIPVEPPDDDDWTPPTPPIPPIPPVPPVPPTPPVTTPDTVFVIGSRAAVTSATTGTAAHYMWALGKTNNFSADSPSWMDMLPPQVSGTFVDYVPNPYNPGYDGYYLCEYELWHLTGLDATGSYGVVATLILTASDAMGYTGVTGSYLRFLRISASEIGDGLNTIYVRATLRRTSPDCNNLYVFYCHQAASPVWITGLITGTVLFYNEQDATGGIGFALGKSNKQLAYSSGKEGRVFRTLDGGQTWLLAIDRPDQYWGQADIFIPRASPYGDNAVYLLGCGPSSPYVPYVWRTYDAFATTGTDISPYYNGGYYGGPFGSAETPHFRRNKIVSKATNPSALAATLTGSGSVTGYTDMRLFTSADGGDSWTHRMWFSGSAVGGLIMHPYDSTKLYLMGNILKGWDGIWMSEDSGATFVNKMGDWPAVFKAHPTRQTAFYYHQGLIYPIF